MEGHVDVDDRAPGGVVAEGVEAFDRERGVGNLAPSVHHLPDRLDLERLAEPEDVDDVGAVEDRELDAAVGQAPQQALVDQDLRRRPERMPGDPQPLREVRLAQARSGLQGAVEDHLAEGVRGRVDYGYGA